MLNIKPSDKFRWYVKRNKNGYIKVSAIYIGNNINKYKYLNKL